MSSRSRAEQFSPPPAAAFQPIGAIAIARLPRLAQVLWLDSKPVFITLGYGDFVTFVDGVSAQDAPDIDSVLPVAGEHGYVTLRADKWLGFLFRLKVTDGVDESHYLKKYPDVRMAIDRKQVLGATAHYLFQGYLERREAIFRDGAAEG